MKISRFGMLDEDTTNAALSWGVLALLALAGVQHFASGDVLWAGLAVIVIGVILVPPAFERNPRTIVGWELTVIAAGIVFALFVRETDDDSDTRLDLRREPVPDTDRAG